jgi:hypothetical protein
MSNQIQPNPPYCKALRPFFQGQGTQADTAAEKLSKTSWPDRNVRGPDQNEAEPQASRRDNAKEGGIYSGVDNYEPK